MTLTAVLCGGSFNLYPSASLIQNQLFNLLKIKLTRSKKRNLINLDKVPGFRNPKKGIPFHCCFMLSRENEYPILESLEKGV